MWLESLDSPDISVLFVPLAVYFSMYQIMLSLCNTQYDWKEARNSQDLSGFGGVVCFFFLYKPFYG